MLKRGPVTDDAGDSEEESKAEVARKATAAAARKRAMSSETFHPSDLIEIGLLGSGSFGRVTLVKHKTVRGWWW